MADLEIDPAALPGPEGYFLLTGLVVPRPIAWVSSLAEDGTPNLAPHSYFNACSSKPLIVHFTSTGVKDTLRNVEATGEFVVNIVTMDLVEQMNVTAADFPPHEDEFAWAGLATAPSKVVAPPRVAASPAALECRVHEIKPIGNGNMVFGDVVHIHVAERVWRDGRVDPALLAPVGRLAGSAYLAPGEVLKIPRPTWQEVRDRHGAG